jgi:beta-lactamase superfamily II metal-dependent hydrolase
MPEFLATGSLQIGMISTGEQNSYDHPNPKLLQALHATVLRVQRTDQAGIVQAITDGHSRNLNFFQRAHQETVSASAQPTNDSQRD